MNRLRAIAIEEQRQLITLGFAVVVFLMTLLALQVHGRGSQFSRLGSATRDAARPATHMDGGASLGNRAVALAAAPTMEVR
jgi:hypothetical protein